jgi:pimeloyl-ACP methyl ester carboxylesterase
MFMFIHGGGHSSRCWEPLLPYLAAPAVAIDLPGRGTRPGPLGEIGVADFVDAVQEEIAARESEAIVLVGHSMAGLTIPGVLARSQPAVRHVVFVSCAIPPDGDSLLGTLRPEVRKLVEATPPSPEGAAQTIEEVVVGQTYDMDDGQRAFTLEVVVPEASWPLREPIDLAGLQRPVPRTWVKLMRDESFPPDIQDEMAKRAGCADVIELDSGHMAMISHPAELATVLNQIHADAVGGTRP